MNWKKWKRGLVISFLTGIAGGLVGLAIDLTLKQIGIIFAANIGKDLFLYLTKHPIDSISDTEILIKP